MTLDWPLLDFGLSDKGPRRLPFGEIVGHPYELAWPVCAYRVTLPQVTQQGNGLNTFERLVLEMIKTGLRGSANISHETCLPEDLVRVILSSLRDKGLVNEKDENVEKKEDEIADGDVPTTVAAYVFREMVGGRLLPYLHSVESGGGLKREFSIEEKYLKVISCQKVQEVPPPDPQEVYTAFQMMVRRLSVREKGRLKYLKVGQIRVVSRPERYYLRCPMAFQPQGEHRIVNPFGGKSFSLELERAFENKLRQDDKLSDWFMEKYNRLLVSPSGGPRVSQDRFADIRQKYPLLCRSLTPQEGRNFRTVDQLCGALEWAFFYFCGRYSSVKDAMDLIEHTKGNYARRQKLLQSAFDLIGFHPTEPWLISEACQLKVSGWVDYFKQGRAESSVVVTLALLAGLNDPDARETLRRLTALPEMRDVDLIDRIRHLNGSRNDVMHPGGQNQREDREQRDDPWVRAVVQTLLPEVKFEKEHETSQGRISLRNERIFAARGFLQGHFGFGVFNSFARPLQECLVDCEVSLYDALNSSDEERKFDVCDGICRLCVACQTVLSECGERAGWNFEIPSEERLFAIVEDRAQVAGLFRGSFGPSLHPRYERICQALEGRQVELGGQVIAFLIQTQPEDLKILAQGNPRFLKTLDDLLQKRGHGNEPVWECPRDIRRLRNEVYLLIKQLKEI